MALLTPDDVRVPVLGPCTVASPLGSGGTRFIEDAHRVLLCSDTRQREAYDAAGHEPPAFEMAGPRARVFFEPREVVCGIATCGGLCPGLNNVIRSVVLTSAYGYGVERVLGFRYGYEGLSAARRGKPRVLTPETVKDIHTSGGTILGSSRGPHDIGELVATLERYRVNVLYAVGGDGTLRGAAALCREIARRRLRIAVIGVPKTIDNDLLWIERSFGFATAVDEARRVVGGAHCEARGAWNGVGLVKLMGRDSGSIAAHASVANSDVNLCLVPEVPFTLHGLLAWVVRRLTSKHHAVIIVSEGAGQQLLAEPGPVERDASGNIRLKDIGTFVRDRILEHAGARRLDVTVKYFDPSYQIRSLPANSIDAESCLALGQHAVHAGLSGRTGMAVGYWNQRFTHVPFQLATTSRRCLDPGGAVWQSVLEATGQPAALTEAELTR